MKRLLIMSGLLVLIIAVREDATLGDIVRGPTQFAADVVEGAGEVAGDIVDAPFHGVDHEHYYADGREYVDASGRVYRRGAFGRHYYY